MARPKATIFLSNGNIGGTAPSEFGVTGVALATTAAPTAGYEIPFLVKSKKQAGAAFAASGNADVLMAIEAFFDEAPEGTKLYIVCAENTDGLEELVTASEKVLQQGNGAVRLLGLVKFPADDYEPIITDGFDQDVHEAVIAVQTLADTWLADRKPFRALVQGYGFTDATDAKDYSGNNKHNAGIVVGAVDSSTALALMLALGRAAREEPQRNIGRVKSGSLAIAETAVVKIGDTNVDEMDTVDLDTLHEKRYITFERNEAAPGYIFNDDNLLTAPDDDYNNLRYGRIIDNAVRVAYSAYYEELKDDVDVDAGGRLAKVIEKALETKIETAIDQQIRAQLSRESNGTAAVKCLVNPDPAAYAALYEANEITNPNFNLLQSGTVYIFVSLRPKGCLKYINIYLGFTTE